MIVLPYDPIHDRVLLVEKFRAGPFARQGENPWCLEPIAELMDQGETPEEAGLREAHEEAGLTLRVGRWQLSFARNINRVLSSIYWHQIITEDHQLSIWSCFRG